MSDTRTSAVGNNPTNAKVSNTEEASSSTSNGRKISKSCPKTALKVVGITVGVLLIGSSVVAAAAVGLKLAVLATVAAKLTAQMSVMAVYISSLFSLILGGSLIYLSLPARQPKVAAPASAAPVAAPTPAKPPQSSVPAGDTTPQSAVPTPTPAKPPQASVPSGDTAPQGSSDDDAAVPAPVPQERAKSASADTTQSSSVSPAAV